MTTGSTTVSYGQLRSLIDNQVDRLAAAGVRAGDRVTVEFLNGIDFAVAFHAVVHLGAVAVPLSPLSGDVAGYCVRAQVRWRCGEAGLRRVSAAAAEPGEPAGAGLDAVACLPFSSGTTGGLPKPVMLTHRNVAANVEQFAAVAPLRRGETVLSMLPMSHIYGLTVLLNVPLAMGAHVIAEPFAAPRFISAQRDFPVGLSFIAPPLAALLASRRDLGPDDFPHLHTMISGAAPLAPATARAAEARTGARIMQGYGMTETSPVTHLAYVEGTPVSSVGSPLPGTQQRIVVPRTEEVLPDGVVGELCVRGPQVMRGYWDDPVATRGTFGPDGWLHTGDAAVIDPERQTVEIVDRLKDLIKFRGFSVSPVKVENVLLTHPELIDAAVVRGFQPGSGQEQPVAAVVPARPDAPPTLRQLQDFLRPHLAGYELIRDVVCVPQLPRSAAGKILRHKVAEFFAA